MKPRSTRRGRLSRSAEFERVYRHGKSVANRHLVLYTFPNQAVEQPRLGLSVSRKVGGAVERNRVKRLLRESFDRVQADLSGGQDLVVVARPEARELAEREGLDGMDTALLELLARAGLRVGAPTLAGGSAAAADAVGDSDDVDAGSEVDGESGPQPDLDLDTEVQAGSKAS